MMSLIPWTIYLCFAGAAILFLSRADMVKFHRWLALSVTVLCTVIALLGANDYSTIGDHGVITLTRVSWISLPWLSEHNPHSFEIHYFLAVDGTSLILILLTGIVATAGVLFSWNITQRTKEFFALYLLLIGGVFGVFMSFDLFLFMVFYEIAIIPKYFLIAIWGSTNRHYGAMQLALYSFVGSALALAGILASWALYGTFDLLEIARNISANSHLLFDRPHSDIVMTVSILLFLCTFIGFGILAGMWPFHTWAPVGHVAAPTAASMLLAGVVMKLGAYGCLRVAMNIFPLGLSSCLVPLCWLAIIGIIVGAITALVQEDFKFVIGYSSVSHMGWVLLGCLTVVGQGGAIFQMFSHGILAGLMFAIVGRMVYERTHTRDLKVLETIGLAKKLPFAAACFVIAAAASMGMPGFSGFPAEVSILCATLNVGWLGFAVAAAVSIIFAAAYMLRATQRAFYSGIEPKPHDDDHPLPPITCPEKVGACMLIAVSLIVGLRPDLLMNLATPVLQPYVLTASHLLK